MDDHQEIRDTIPQQKCSSEDEAYRTLAELECNIVNLMLFVEHTDMEPMAREIVEEALRGVAAVRCNIQPAMKDVK